MKYSLLDMTQTILSSMDADEVNSINDNAEATSVALIIRTCYYNLASRPGFPEHFGTFNLNASGTSDKPILMTKPDNVQSVQWIKYNKEDTTITDLYYSDINFIPLEDFLRMTYSLTESETTVDSMLHTVNGSDLTILFRNDKHPDYFTTFDDNTILFDSYLAEVDTTLQRAKSLAFGKMSKVFSMQDTFVPDLDEDQFALLLNEAKALAFSELKQVVHTKAERMSRNLLIQSQKTKDALTPYGQWFNSLPNYGRKSRYNSIDPRLMRIGR